MGKYQWVQDIRIENMPGTWMSQNIQFWMTWHLQRVQRLTYLLGKDFCKPDIQAFCLPSQKMLGNFSAKDIDGSLVKRPMIKDQFVDKWRRLHFLCMQRCGWALGTEWMGRVHKPSETQDTGERGHFSWRHTETVWVEAGWHNNDYINSTKTIQNFFITWLDKEHWLPMPNTTETIWKEGQK